MTQERLTGIPMDDRLALLGAGHDIDAILAKAATIFFNQTSAAGLYSIEDFRVVCDTLDLESAQERAHINAFKKIAEEFEEEVFGERVFTYPMRGPYAETMIHAKTSLAKSLWRKLRLNAYGLLSSNNAFIGCQYFAVRGVRTLNGKLIQHQLSQFYFKDPDKEHAPIPSKVSYHHFRDESFHFNSSTVISHEVLNSMNEPTPFEKWVANQGLRGSQKDHYHFSTAINGLFWYDPALFPKVYKILRSPIFGMTTRTSPPCPTTNITPTAASDQPVSIGPQWKRYDVNSTHVTSATRFAKLASTKIAMRPSTDE